MSDTKGGKPITSSSFYILLALADRELHGLGIVSEVEGWAGADVQLGPGTLYMSIKNLLVAGLIAEPPELRKAGDDTRRRYYRITRAGRLALKAELSRLYRLLKVARKKRLIKSSTSGAPAAQHA